MAQDAKRMGKKGVSIIDDMGSFFLYEKQNQMIEYETELQLDEKKNDDANSVKVKGICAYHKDNFKTLKKKEQQALFEHHNTNLVVVYN
jgi:hypothetical protein